MKDEIIKLLAERYFNEGDVNDWAIKCLEKGYDSRSLRILASMSKWDSGSELDDYFQRSLKELNWDKIEKHDYLMKYAEILAQEIVEDKTDPIKAARKIYRVLVSLDYPSELHGWNMIDEMIWSYEHFATTGKTSHFWKPEEGLKKEIINLSKNLLESKKQM